ncbi:ABC transporter substrate-binding protein [Phaeodactylibacter luteus]|uniref:ABC transporter substrate-binding protein n=1 Tax=Phaeodactylibacter luteus TaxID=1564516 RepID=A0A5C6RFA7_9BACT|nr:helical backbone metal receptor [Phaeodactylibacter luteus]TXB60090.1 ABC transporter substrate-binding protein [Phaeodactylibacter luteus]
MPTIKDMLGRALDAPALPYRIISLVPSQTELLSYLGLGERVVGITKFCVHPQAWYRSKVRVGGTKQVHFDRISALDPDLILANKEENTREMVEALAEDYPIWVSDVDNLDTALQMIGQIGKIVGKGNEAAALAKQVQEGFGRLRQEGEPPLRAAYLIWERPLMVAGGGTFIDDMLCRAGFENVFRGQPRYPESSLESLSELAPDVVLLSSEPFPFRQQHIAAYRKALPEAAILLADGELFSWYGSRLLDSPAYFAKLSAEASRQLAHIRQSG